VQHVTGIPHNPTGQAIAERAHQTLKLYLQKYKDIRDVQERLSKALFVLNHLCIFADMEGPPVQVHSRLSKPSEGAMRVMYKDLSTGIWKGP
ncbi:POK6 protein, partial [Probosciger aterrimus]|nr:POK6 protein [Probosciger aterrimus]